MRLLVAFVFGVVVGAAIYLWFVFRPIRVGLSPAHRRALDADQWSTC